MGGAEHVDDFVLVEFLEHIAGGAVAYMTVMVHDRDELTAAIRKLRGLRGVRDVVRPGV